MSSKNTSNTINNEQDINDILYINLCIDETKNYLNCVHNEPYGIKCDKHMLFKLILKCKNNYDIKHD
jgi:hypothetical protein